MKNPQKQDGNTTKTLFPLPVVCGVYAYTIHDDETWKHQNVKNAFPLIHDEVFNRK